MKNIGLWVKKYWKKNKSQIEMQTFQMLFNFNKMLHMRDIKPVAARCKKL